MRNYVFVGHFSVAARLPDGRVAFEAFGPEIKAPKNYTNVDKINEYVKNESENRKSTAAETPIYGDFNELVVCTPDGNPLRVASTNYKALVDFLESKCPNGAHWVGFDMASFGGRLVMSAARRGITLDHKWWVGEKTDLISTIHGGGSKLDAATLAAAFAQLPTVHERKAVDDCVAKWKAGERSPGGDCLLALALGLALGFTGGRG